VRNVTEPHATAMLAGVVAGASVVVVVGAVVVVVVVAVVVVGAAVVVAAVVVVGSAVVVVVDVVVVDGLMLGQFCARAFCRTVKWQKKKKTKPEYTSSYTNKHNTHSTIKFNHNYLTCNFMGETHGAGSLSLT
jgi:hypothetical protein